MLAQKKTIEINEKLRVKILKNGKNGKNTELNISFLIGKTTASAIGKKSKRNLMGSWAQGAAFLMLTGWVRTAAGRGAKGPRAPAPAEA